MREPESTLLRGTAPWAIIFFAAFALRAAMVLWQPPSGEELLHPLADAGDYHHLTISLLEGRGFASPTGEPTAFRPPVYPVFLALVYTIAGTGNAVAVAWLQAVIGAFNALLAGAVARQAGWPRRTALLAAGIFALYPAFIFQTPQILTEVLARTLLLGAVWTLLNAWHSGQWWRYAIAGALMAAAILNKPALGAAVPFIGLLVLWRSGETWRQRCLRVLAYALPAALILGSWAARNALHSGRFIPTSTNFSITFSQGVTKYSFYTDQWYGNRAELLEAPDDFLRLTQLRAYRGMEEELTVGAEWSARARAWIAENRPLFAILTARKVLHYWSPTIRNEPLVQMIAFATMAPVLLGGWWCLYTLWRRGNRRERHLAWLCIAIALPPTLAYAISQPDVRYRLAIADPLWIVLLAGWIGGCLRHENAVAPIEDNAVEEHAP